MMIPNRRKGALAALVTIGLAVAMTLMVTMARAAVTAGNNSLTISFCGNNSWQDDFATAQPVAELFKVAEAIPRDGEAAYDYDFEAMGFEGVTIGAEPNDDDWTEVASKVSTLLTEDMNHVTLRGTNTTEGLDDGLYMLLVHDDSHPVAYGNGIASSLIVDTAGWSYSFAPVIVGMPSRDLVDGAFTDWTHDVEATLKPTRAPGIGSIRIEKTVRRFDGKEATLVFHIVGTDRDGNVRYDERRSLVVSAGDSSEAHASVVIGDIPTDLTVSVTEEYAGAGYTLVDSASPDNPITVRGTQPSFSFVNEKTDTSETGGGVTNRFVYDEEGDQDWNWHADGQGNEGSES